MLSSEHISRYADLPLVVETELGRCMLPMREVLALSAGSVIKLPLPAGSKVHLLVGGAPFAAGEVVRHGEAKAVRLLNFDKRKGD